MGEGEPMLRRSQSMWDIPYRDRQARDASPSCADFVWGPSQKSSVTKDYRSLKKSSCHQGLLRFPLVELLSNYGKRMIPILPVCLPSFP
ncbi:hypothetical protein CEXT_559011 [Caerostris extrusa]|uniref:Uncharacterized protein n=1 Tax=Caerostris extrusa TaxID=172846 RepID=A0AAV4R7G9_CAEEX|nr:hypothetical protein CEXT_559011 [Caerostris extrusa]